MGATHSSIPPPLVEVSAPGGRVLVPPYTQFSVHPPHHGDPVYHPARRPRRPRRLPRPRPDFVIEEDEFGSESEFGMESPRMGGRGFGGRMGGMRGGMGMGGMGGMGMGRGGPMFEMDGRPRSAPEMGMGAFPGMASPRMGMGMPGMGPGGMGGMGPGMGGMGGMGPPGGMGGPGMGGMGGPGMGGMGPPGGMGGMGPPPGYTPMQSMPRYNDAPGGNPYGHAAAPPSPPSSTGASSEKPMRRPSRRPPGVNEHVPMGVYAKAQRSPRLSRSRTEPTTADRLNRGQPGGRRVGPSGKEWLKGDDFLDACVCTTGCTCREGHRVLYRSRDDAVGSDSDYEAGPRYNSGEIRYILKSKLGQDCGDHSGCKKSASSSESEGEIKRRKKKEEKRQKKQFNGLKEDMLEAIDERLEAIKKARSSKAPSVSSLRPPFAGFGPGPNAFGGKGDPNGITPLMAQKLGMGGNPYAIGMQGMGKMPPGMMDPMSSRQMRPGQMPMGGMGFQDDLSIADMEGLAMGNPYLAGGMKGNGMQSRFMSPGRRNPGGLGDMDMDATALYGRGTGVRPGMLGRRGPRDLHRRRFGSEDFDLGGRRLGEKNRGNIRGGGFGDLAGDGRGEDDNDDGPIVATHRGSPNGGRNLGRGSGRNRERHARAETDDDDEY